MRLLLMTALGALAACAADASPQTAIAETAPAPIYASEPAPNAVIAHAAQLSCDLVATRTAHGVELRAMAASPHGASGEYELTITKNDRGGSSDIVQGGAFDLAAGERAALGSAEISLERGGSYRAHLLLTDANGPVCETERSR